MTPLNIKILAFDEAKFEYNTSYQTLPDEVLNDMEVGFNPILNYKEGKRTLGIQLSISFIHKKTIILSYGVVLTVFVEEFSKIINEHENIKSFFSNSDVKESLCDLAVGFVRGALAIRAKDTIVKDLFIPTFNIKELAARMEVVYSK